MSERFYTALVHPASTEKTVMKFFRISRAVINPHDGLRGDMFVDAVENPNLEGYERVGGVKNEITGELGHHFRHSLTGEELVGWEEPFETVKKVASDEKTA